MDLTLPPANSIFSSKPLNKSFPSTTQSVSTDPIANQQDSATSVSLLEPSLIQTLPIETIQQNSALGSSLSNRTIDHRINQTTSKSSASPQISSSTSANPVISRGSDPFFLAQFFSDFFSDLCFFLAISFSSGFLPGKKFDHQRKQGPRVVPKGTKSDV